MNHLGLLCLAFSACQSAQTGNSGAETTKRDSAGYVQVSSQPLIKSLYTADPSAHVFNGKIYIYPSHDVESGKKNDDSGDQYDMRDYHILSMDSIGADVKDHGVALDMKDVPWVSKQMWAPDAAFANGKYYLFFPAKDKDGIFRIGVATSASPSGPFTPEEKPIRGSYSMDPAVFKDDDGAHYMYFGGIWGGQLQSWRTGKYDAEGKEPADNEAAIGPRFAKMSSDMKSFSGSVKEIKIVDDAGKPILAGDHDRRFFEAAWMHKYKGKYYLSYSTGDTHKIVYATGDRPDGPFTYRGTILMPVLGWTNHHSIVEFKGRWYLFYHDTSLSEGKNYLRSVKVAELFYNNDGSIKAMQSSPH